MNAVCDIPEEFYPIGFACAISSKEYTTKIPGVCLCVFLLFAYYL